MSGEKQALDHAKEALQRLARVEEKIDAPAHIIDQLDEAQFAVRTDVRRCVDFLLDLVHMLEKQVNGEVRP